MFLPVSLSSSQLNSADIIAKINPKLSNDILSLIVHTVKVESKNNNIEPSIVYAVMAVESNFKPTARGRAKETGLMQLNPKYFTKQNSIQEHIKAGVQYLSQMRQQHVYIGYRWLELYNRGPYTNPTKFTYTKKVLKHYVLFRSHD